MHNSKDITVYSPNSYPVKLDDGLTWLRDVDSSEHALVQSLIYSATAVAENIAGQDLMEKTYELTCDGSNTSSITLDKWPVDSISSVIAKLNGSNVTLQTSDYYLIHHKWGDELVFTNNLELDDVYNAVKVTYTTKPRQNSLEIATQAIKMIVAKWFDTRASGKQEYPETAEVMLTGIRIRCI